MVRRQALQLMSKRLVFHSEASSSASSRGIQISNASVAEIYTVLSSRLLEIDGSTQIGSRRTVETHVCTNMKCMEKPSHSRGVPEVPEPLLLGAQYLTRSNTWKKFVRATRPALVCARPKTNMRVKFHPHW